MNPLRIGLIGTGNIAKSHLRAYREIPEQALLTAVCDTQVESAQRIADEFGHDRIWSSYEAFIKEAPIDAVDIALPHFLHYPVAKAALNAGKHVLVEKPFAIAMSECRELVDLAEAKGLTLMVGQVQRYNATYARLKEIIANGELGAIHHARIDAIQNLGDFVPSTSHWLFDGDKAGGGGVISVCIHRIDLLRYLIGDARRVIAAVTKQVNPAFRNAEDYCLALIEFECGAIVDLFSTYSAGGYPYGEMFWIFGDKGVVHTIPGEAKTQLTTPRITFATERGGGKEFSDVEPAKSNLTGSTPFVNEIAHFAECVQKGSEPLSSGRDNLKSMAIVFAIYESAKRGGAAVSIDEVLNG